MSEITKRIEQQKQKIEDYFVKVKETVNKHLLKPLSVEDLKDFKDLKEINRLLEDALPDMKKLKMLDDAQRFKWPDDCEPVLDTIKVFDSLDQAEKLIEAGDLVEGLKIKCSALELYIELLQKHIVGNRSTGKNRRLDITQEDAQKFKDAYQQKNGKARGWISAYAISLGVDQSTLSKHLNKIKSPGRTKKRVIMTIS